MECGGSDMWNVMNRITWPERWRAVWRKKGRGRLLQTWSKNIATAPAGPEFLLECRDPPAGPEFPISRVWPPWPDFTQEVLPVGSEFLPRSRDSPAGPEFLQKVLFHWLNQNFPRKSKTPGGPEFPRGTRESAAGPESLQEDTSNGNKS